ncbi:hypothetical protein Ddc_22057 [Ditylenchus destructor]|nr:hypothetical protein Ddc_22057 [Ditylenchus destructor]
MLGFISESRLTFYYLISFAHFLSKHSPIFFQKQCFLSQTVLSQVVLPQDVLSQIALSQAVLSLVVLSQAVLSQIVLPQIVLSQVVLSQVVLPQAVLSQIALSQAVLSLVVLSQVVQGNARLDALAEQLNATMMCADSRNDRAKGAGIVAQSTAYERYSMLKSGNLTIEDNLRSGRPSEKSIKTLSSTLSKTLL